MASPSLFLSLSLSLSHTHTHACYRMYKNTFMETLHKPYPINTLQQIWAIWWANQEDSRLRHPRCFKRLACRSVCVCACMYVCLCVCGGMYIDVSLIEKSWWLGPCIKGLRRSRTASGSNNAASNPSLPQRLGPGWQPTAIFTTLLLTSLHFSFPPFFCHSSIEFCLLSVSF